MLQSRNHLEEAANAFRKKSAHKEVLSYAVNTYVDRTIKEVEGELNYYIKSSLQKANLKLPFKYAVYVHLDDNGKNHLVYGFGHTKISKILPVCSQAFDKASQSYQVPLTCSIIPDNPFHLAVLLPTQNSYLFSTLIKSLLASIIFTLALISLFIYFLYLAYKQKKLSQIKDDFINNLTHEFKTPLFSIGLAARLLKKSENIKEQHHLSKYVSLIETEKARLENQVN